MESNPPHRSSLTGMGALVTYDLTIVGRAGGSRFVALVFLKCLMWRKGLMRLSGYDRRIVGGADGIQTGSPSGLSFCPSECG